MKHNPNNPNCDRVQYGGAPETMCTCDVDSPDDAPSPSVVMPAVPLAVPVGFAPQPGTMVLTGRKATTYAELETATRELDAARRLLAPAEARWKAALDAHAQEMLRA